MWWPSTTRSQVVYTPLETMPLAWEDTSILTLAWNITEAYSLGLTVHTQILQLRPTLKSHIPVIWTSTWSSLLHNSLYKNYITPEEDPKFPIQLQNRNLVKLLLQQLNYLAISPPSTRKEFTYDKDVPAWLQYVNKVSYEKDVVLGKWKINRLP